MESGWNPLIFKIYKSIFRRVSVRIVSYKMIWITLVTEYEATK